MYNSIYNSYNLIYSQFYGIYKVMNLVYYDIIFKWGHAIGVISNHYKQRVDNVRCLHKFRRWNALGEHVDDVPGSPGVQEHSFGNCQSSRTLRCGARVAFKCA